ncbi:MAG: hypothetical protein ACREKL_13740, partial [Chthoniobacterales bacterium]
EAVCTGDGVDVYDALDLLQLLVDKSLLNTETDATETPRYTMIESVWQYARERLEASGEFDMLRVRHLDYFLAYAEEAKPGLEGPETARWLDRITADQFNFRSALEWSARSPATVQKGLRIAGALTRYAEIRGNLEEMRDLTTELLAAPGAEEPTLARAYALIGAGRVAWCRDSSEDALKYYREAIPLLEKFDRRRDVILQGAFMSFIERNLGIYEHAEGRFQRSLDAGREFNDVVLTAVGMSGLGAVAADRGDLVTSRRLREESLAIYRSTGDQWVSGYILWGIARSCTAEGDAAGAREALEEWTSIARKLGNRWITPYLLLIFAEVLLIEGDAPLAARILGATEAGCEALGIVFDSAERAEWDALLARLNEKLDAPTRLREWNEGRKLGVWEAIDLATHARPAAAVAA